jgi:hypothetical protein
MEQSLSGLRALAQCRRQRRHADDRRLTSVTSHPSSVQLTTRPRAESSVSHPTCAGGPVYITGSLLYQLSDDGRGQRDIAHVADVLIMETPKTPIWRSIPSVHGASPRGSRTDLAQVVRWPTRHACEPMTTSIDTIWASEIRRANALPRLWCSVSSCRWADTSVYRCICRLLGAVYLVDNDRRNGRDWSGRAVKDSRKPRARSSAQRRTTARFAVR